MACGRCNGKGFINYVVTFHGEHDQYGTERCPKCHGIVPRVLPRQDDNLASTLVVCFCAAGVGLVAIGLFMLVTL